MFVRLLQLSYTFSWFEGSTDEWTKLSQRAQSFYQSHAQRDGDTKKPKYQTCMCLYVSVSGQNTSKLKFGRYDEYMYAALFFKC